MLPDGWQIPLLKFRAGIEKSLHLSQDFQKIEKILRFFIEYSPDLKKWRISSTASVI